MSNNSKIKYSKNDEFYTPKILVEAIVPYIPKGSTVWCPFDTENSEFVLVLREHGFKVIHSHIWEGKDFMTYEPKEHYDCIISNPPFSKKLEVFQRLFDLNKPFAMIMNSMAEQYQNIGNFFYRMSEQGKYIQKLNIDKKISFDGNTSCFNSSFFCYKMLPRDYMMCHLEHNNTGKYYVPSRMLGDRHTAV